MGHPVAYRLLAAIFLAVTAVTTVGPAAPERATPTGRAESMGSRLQLSVQRAQLENGLRVVMNVDRGAPNVAVCITYGVGSRNEEPGRSGFAHLFEHMMFQGSGNVSKGEHFTLITARGGSLNGTTSSDRTNYFQLLPSGELPLGLWLEADRMKSLEVTEENFINQRAVVQEEYRMRVSNAAYARGYIRLKELVFDGYWPYSHDAIGSMADLDAAKFDWVKKFHESYYAPNNAVLSIAGDFDPDEAMQLVREYFGDATPTTVPLYEPPPVPEQTIERTATMTDAQARTPGLMSGWLIPANREPEHYALEIATVVLGYGESSRLHQRLVRETATARSVGVWTNDHRGPDLFALRVLLTERATFDEIQAIIDRELEDLRRRGPTEAELEKARNRVASAFLFGFQSNLSRAVRLGEYELYYDDARLLARELDRYHAVTREQVRDAVRRYLIPERRSTVRVLPTESEEPGGANPTPSRRPQ